MRLFKRYLCCSWALMIIGSLSFSPLYAQMLTADHIKYLGSFRLPKGTFGASTIEYGGYGAIFYNHPTHGPCLFLEGNASNAFARMAMVEIPDTLVDSTRWEDLPMAEVRIPFVNFSSGFINTSGNAAHVYGGLVYNNRLILSGSIFYGYNSQMGPTHRAVSLDLGTPLSNWEQFGSDGSRRSIGGYMALIPQEWRASFGGAPVMSGLGGESVISANSAGPALFLMDPDDLGSAIPPHAATKVQHYPLGEPGTLVDDTPECYTGACPDDYFQLSTKFRGAVIPSGFETIMFLGMHSYNDSYCYSVNTTCAAQFNEPVCTPTASGPHSSRWKWTGWLYDIHDVIDVYKGNKQPHEARPYDLLKDVFQQAHPNWTCDNEMMSVAYDPESRRLYIAHDFYITPDIAVFEIADPGGAVLPLAPKNLSVE